MIMVTFTHTYILYKNMTTQLKVIGVRYTYRLNEEFLFLDSLKFPSRPCLDFFGRGWLSTCYFKFVALSLLWNVQFLYETACRLLLIT